MPAIWAAPISDAPAWSSPATSHENKTDCAPKAANQLDTPAMNHG